MNQNTITKPASCKTLEIYQSFSAALEKAFYSNDWDALSEFFADNLVYRHNSEPSYSIESSGKENVKKYYETHFGQIEHQVNGERTRGNIHRLRVDGNYIKVWVDIIYKFKESPSIILSCEEEVWLNEADKIEKIVLFIPSAQLQLLTDHLEHLQKSLLN